MQLPCVNVIGIQKLERHVEVFKRGIAGSLFGLGCDKNVVPAGLKSELCVIEDIKLFSGYLQVV